MAVILEPPMVCAKCSEPITAEMPEEVKAYFRASPALLVHEVCPKDKVLRKRVYYAEVVITRRDTDYAEDGTTADFTQIELMRVADSVEGETFTAVWDQLGHAIVRRWNEAAKYSDLADRDDERGGS